VYLGFLVFVNKLGDRCIVWLARGGGFNDERPLQSDGRTKDEKISNTTAMQVTRRSDAANETGCD